MIHLYIGDGKGKTTAAAGLAARAAGAGRTVLFAQFLKDGSSSEIRALERLPGVTALHCDTVRGWFRDMGPDERETARRDYGAFLEALIARADTCDLLVLDEAVAACGCGLIDEGRLLAFLDGRPERPEIVLTGRSPSEALIARADYITEMKKIRHPFDRGVRARKGVEY